jgi:hypothetical protein
MTEDFMPDLTECSAVNFRSVLSIGWLNRFYDYTKIKNYRDLSSRESLRNISKCHWIESQSMFLGYSAIHNIEILKWRGYMHCPFCKLGARPRFCLSSALVIPDAEISNKFFIFPALISHFVDDHYYVPPDSFVDSVFAFKQSQDFSVENIYSTLQFPSTKEGEFMARMEKEDSKRFFGEFSQ